MCDIRIVYCSKRESEPFFASAFIITQETHEKKKRDLNIKEEG